MGVLLIHRCVFSLLAAALLFGASACEKDVIGTAPSNETDNTDPIGTTGTAGTDPSDTETYYPKDTDTCANLDLSLNRQPVTIMLVIDHSASMDLQLGDNDTRWSVMVKALMGTSNNPEAGFVWAMQNQVYFGMVLFTAKRGDPQTCPMLESVMPTLNAAPTIASIFKADDETYKGASPVPEGILAAVDMLETMKADSRKVILLATDGSPQTCNTLAVLDDPEGRTATIQAVQAAFNKGISTFVVGIGDVSSLAFLQQVANAGVGLTPAGSDNAPYFQGETENTLSASISSIITSESKSCIYELSGKGVAPGEEAKGSLLLDGVELPLGAIDNGWRLKSPSEIELLGDACTTIQIGSHHLTADFPCEVIIEID